MPGQYLNSVELMSATVNAKITPIAADTYDETLILAKVKTLNVDSLFACALQSSIIGTGNKVYGKVKINDQEFNCKDLLIKNDVIITTRLNDKLEPDTLTLRRLCRLFRYHISDYILETGVTSYLYKKYNKLTTAKPEMIFPGAEHLVVHSDDAFALYECYRQIDVSLNTKFVDRIKRVYQARGVTIHIP